MIFNHFFPYSSSLILFTKRCQVLSVCCLVCFGVRIIRFCHVMVNCLSSLLPNGNGMKNNLKFPITQQQKTKLLLLLLLLMLQCLKSVNENEKVNEISGIWYKCTHTHTDDYQKIIIPKPKLLPFFTNTNILFSLIINFFFILLSQKYIHQHSRMEKKDWWGSEKKKCQKQYPTKRKESSKNERTNRMKSKSKRKWSNIINE